MKAKLELVREQKLYKLLPGRKKKSPLEASGVTVVNGNAYIIFDSLNLVGKVDPSLKSGRSNRLIPALSPGTGFEDITFDHEDGTQHTLWRLREGMERFFITDINNAAASSKAQSELPVMFDYVAERVQDYNHVPGGGNVLYLDGHVDFLRFPSTFPASRAWASFLTYL